MADRIVPEVFPPGEFIRDSLTARGWKQIDLSQIMGVPPSVVNDLVSGKRRITRKTAQTLADAFGNEAEEWTKLQAIYDGTVRALQRDDTTARRSQLWRRVPVRHAIDRGWLVETDNVDSLEAQICEFYRTDSLEGITQFPCAARKSTDYGDVNNDQLAWFRRAKNLAEALPFPKKYNPRTFKKLLDELEVLRVEPEDARTVPAVLMRHGIRFLIIEHLPGSKIDGVCFWLGDEPTVVLSMRYDRIDCFWFTLMHELAHVYHGHGKDRPCIDTSLVGSDAQQSTDPYNEEQIANTFASEYLIDSKELDDFIGRVSPLYSDTAIRGFAHRMMVHPGIVIGRLQRIGKIRYSRGRQLLVKIKENIIESALTDGWGHSIEI